MEEQATAAVEEHVDVCAACRRLLIDWVRCASTPVRPSIPPGTRPSVQSIPPTPRPSISSLGCGTLLAERYLVLDLLGMGGMGVVYAAYDRQLDRKIALKLVRGEHGSAERLLREAQTQARLAHPNVVVVHDVGTAMDQAYMAMEYVEGKTLRAWLREARPRPERVLEVYLQAAQGLAAAHAAGLVHRDFKPDNVMISEDGRVRVTDFGLARPLSADSRHSAASVAALSAMHPGTTLEGTPAYIAPERFQGEPSDARSDQFAFCVALYEGLYGEHPFRCSSLRELPAAMQEGRFRPPPRGCRVPGTVRAALLRGLAADPEERFPSMEALSAALRSDVRGRRGKGLAAVALGVALALGGAGVAMTARALPATCSGSERRLVGVWDSSRQKAVEQAFLRTGVPYAETSFRSVREILDRYAERWSTAHTEACVATRVHGEHSEEVLDLRMGCLDARLLQLRAVVDALSQADPRVVERAVEAAGSPSDPDLCDAPYVFGAKMPALPDRATFAKVTELRERLASLDALRRLGKESSVLEDARGLVHEARSVDYLPMRAEANLLFGRLASLRGSPEQAETALTQALLNAEASGYDRAALEAWLELSEHAIRASGRYDDAERYLNHAEAYVERTGEDADRVAVLVQRAALHRARGRHAEGVRSAEEAVLLSEKVYGGEGAGMIRPLVELAILKQLVGEKDASFAMFRRSVRIAEQRLGLEHPALASLLTSYGEVLLHQQRPEDAAEVLGRASAIADRNGVEGAPLGAMLSNLGDALYKRGAYEESLRALRRAVSADEEALSPTHGDLARALGMMGSTLAAAGRYDEALSVALRALDVAQRSDDTAALPETLARTREAFGRCGVSCSKWRRRIDAWEKEQKKK